MKINIRLTESEAELLKKKKEQPKHEGKKEEL